MKALSRAPALLLLLALFGCFFGCGDSGSRFTAPGATAKVQHLAATELLSGTVFGNGVPLENCKVEALTNGTTTTVADFTTNALGHYELALEPDTYDLRVTPPVGSVLALHTVQDVIVGAGGLQRDIAIFSGISVTGRVTGYLGAAIASAGVSVYSNDGNTFLANATTDAGGNYRLNLPDGTYFFSVLYNVSGSSASSAAPAASQLNRYDIVVSGSTSVDFAFPVAKVRGQVVDSNDAPVPDVAISATVSQPDSSPRGYRYSSSIIRSQSDGTYELLVFIGSANFIIQPPPATPFPNTSRNGVSVAGDMTFKIVVSSDANVTGKVTGYADAAIAGAGVSVYSNDGNTFLANATTDAGGNYRLNLPDGTYFFSVLYNVSGSSASSAAPAASQLNRYDIVVSGSTSVDFAFPVAKVRGQVVDSNDAPVPDVAISATVSQPDSSPRGYRYSSSSTHSQSDGTYELLVFIGSANFIIQPPPATPFPNTSRNGVSIAGDMTFKIVVSSDANVTGKVTGYADAAIAGAGVSVYSNDGNTFLANATTDAGGNYRLNLPDGTYFFSVLYNVSGSSASSAAPAASQLNRYDIVVSGSTSVDFAFPVAKVRGQVVDSNDAPVPDVAISATVSQPDSSPRGYRYSSSSIHSQSDGTYELLVFIGSANFIIQPPPASGFTNSSLNGVPLTGDLTQTVILEHPDVTPPIITAGPTVIHLSDTSVSIHWTTNEPADSVVEFGLTTPDQRREDLRLLTQHSVTLVGLAPVSNYKYRVGSTDASKNGPTFSDPSTFDTLSPPGDVTPPMIVKGPDVTFVDRTNAVIEWETDEPADSRVAYSTAVDPGAYALYPADVFTRSHTVLLAGLAPSTTYSARVASMDPESNGPTPSGIFTFTTTEAPDTDPPVILPPGPIASSVTDTSMIISWTTDEPSTSGISYNANGHFETVADRVLTKNHTITLAGLIPNATYNITVASTDPVGNGPTLGGPIQATTLSTPDHAPPILSDLNVTDVTTTTATVTWTTDEPATTVVHYGAISGDLKGRVADDSFVIQHQILVTGLLPGQTYYVTAESFDASKNESPTTPELAFSTLQSDTDNDGIPDSIDNCPTIANRDQMDQDGDGQGNACDKCPLDPANDADDDGLCADRDACPNQPAGPVDSNGDGCPDGVSLSIGDVKLAEGNNGKSNMVFTVTLSAKATTAVTVAYATADGTAAAGSDYQATSGTLKFAAGTVTKTVTVPIKGDKVIEPDETLFVDLTSPVGAALARGQAVGTIVNDDAPLPTISIADAAVAEGKNGMTKMNFAVTLSAASTQTVKVAYATCNGTGSSGATAPSDYTASTGTLSFSPGTTSKTVVVQIKGDTKIEPNETLTVALSSAVNATIARGTGVGTIQNDD